MFREIIEKLFNAMGNTSVPPVVFDSRSEFSRKMHGPGRFMPIVGPLLDGKGNPVKVLSRRYKGREFMAPVKYAPYQPKSYKGDWSDAK